MANKITGTNYYISSGIQITTTAQDIQEQLNKLSADKVLATGIRLKFSTTGLRSGFNTAIRNVLKNSNLGYMAGLATGSGSGGSGIASKVATPTSPIGGLGKNDVSKMGILEQFSTTSRFSLKKPPSVTEMYKYQQNLNTTIRATFKEGQGLISLTKTLTTRASDTTRRYEELKIRLNNLRKIGKLSKVQFRRFTDELEATNQLTGKDKLEALRKIQTELADISKRSQSWLGIFKQNLQKFTSWITITVGFFGIINSIKKLVKEVKAVDDAMVELNKVADLSQTQIAKVQKDANALASRVSTTADEALRAVAQFKKAGYSLDQSFILAETALRTVNVADGIENAEDAATSLIAILRGFNMEATEVGRVLDVLNHISNNFAVDVNNLTDGMQRISAVMAQTGTSYEETIGLLTGGFEILRNAEVVSQGLNTISQRMRRVTEDGQDNSQVISKIEEGLYKYTRGAVSVYDKQTGELRSTYDVLADLATVWDTLSSLSQSYITELLAGNRQNKVLAAIMSNWANVKKVVEESAYAYGSAKEEEQKVLQSVQGKLNALKQAIQEFALRSLTSDTEKGILDILISIVKFGTDLGGLFKILGRLGIIILAWKLPQIILLISSLRTNVIRLTTEINGLTYQYQVMTVMGKEYVIAERSYGEVTNAATNTVNGLTASLKHISIVITALIAVYTAIQFIDSRITESMKKEAEEAEKFYDKNKSQYDTLMSNYDEYIKLITKTDATASEVNKLNVLEKQFALYGIDNEIAQLGTRTDKIEAIADIIRQQALARQKVVEDTANAMAVNKLPSYWYNATQSSAGKGRIHAFQEASFEEKIKMLRNMASNENISASHRDEWQAALEYYEQLYNEWKQLGLAADLEGNPKIIELRTKIGEFLNAADFSLDKTKETQLTMYKSINALVADIEKELSDGSLSGEAQLYIESLLKAYQEQLDIVLNKDYAFEYLGDKLQELKDIQSNREKELERQEKLKAIEEARQKLAEAERTHMLVRTKEGWRYIVEKSTLEEAQAELDSALKNAGLDDLSQAIAGIEALRSIYSLASGSVLDNMRTYFREAGILSNWLASDWESKLKTLDSFGDPELSKKYYDSQKNSTTTGIDLSKFFGLGRTGGYVGDSPNKNLTSIDTNKSQAILSAIREKAKNIILNIDELDLPGVTNASQLVAALTSYAYQKASSK